MAERVWQNFDWLILIPVLLLIVMGLLTLYSVGHVPEDLRDTFQHEESLFFQKQAIRSLLGLAVLVIALVIPFRYYEGTAVLLYLASLILLVVVLLIGPSGRASRWIVFGGFRFQPSEFMKIGVIFLLARFLSGKKSNPNKPRALAISFLLTAIPFLLVVKQPDLGTALVFPALLFPILYWRGLDEGILIRAVAGREAVAAPLVAGLRGTTSTAARIARLVGSLKKKVKIGHLTYA